MKLASIITVVFSCVSLSVSMEYTLLNVECESSAKRTALTEKCDVSGKFFNIITTLSRPLDTKIYVIV